LRGFDIPIYSTLPTLHSPVTIATGCHRQIIYSSKNILYITLCNLCMVQKVASFTYSYLLPRLLPEIYQQASRCSRSRKSEFSAGACGTVFRSSRRWRDARSTISARIEGMRGYTKYTLPTFFFCKFSIPC